MIRLFLLCIALMGMAPLLRADGFPLKRMSQKEGWPNNQVNSIYRDADGYVWMGSMDGLICYDGTRCLTYRYEGNNPTDHDNFTDHLVEDDEGRLWMTAGTGYLYFDRRRRAYARNVDALLRERGIPGTPSLLCADSDKRLWMGVEGKGFYLLEKGRQRALALEDSLMAEGKECTGLAVAGGLLLAVYADGTLSAFDTRSLGRVWTEAAIARTGKGKGYHKQFTLFVDADDEVWIYCTEGVWRMDLRTRRVEEVALTGQDDFVRVMAQDKEGRLWIGKDRSGLEVMDKRTGEVTRLECKPEEEHTLPGNTVTALHCDNEGAVWIGTYKQGVALYHPDLFQFDCLAAGDVNALAPCARGGLWLGLNNGGVVRLDERGNCIRQWTHREGEENSLATDAVVCLQEARDGKLWIGTFRGGLDCLDGDHIVHRRHRPGEEQSLADDNVWDLQEDSCGALWIATLGGGVQRLEPGSERWTTYSEESCGLASNYVYSLSASRRGGWWVGTATRGFAYLDPRQGRAENYVGTRKGDVVLSNLCINQLHEDCRGWLWLATRNGVNLYLPNEDCLYLIGMPRGCSSSFVGGLAEDADGDIWASLTTGGIIRIRVDSLQRTFDTRLFDEKDGLLKGGLNQRSMCSLTGGDLAVGGVQGVNFFSPSAMDRCFVPAVNRRTFVSPRLMAVGGVLLVLLCVTGWQLLRMRRMAARRDGLPQEGNADDNRYLKPELQPEEVVPADEQLIARATRYIEENIRRSELSVEELSSELAMSRVHLYKKMMQLTGKTPTEFIRHIRLQHAAYLLRNSGLTVAEVAFRVGFNNPKYFSRHFKEELGVLPSEYRSQNIT